MVTWKEAQLSWWPPRWVAGNEESSIKVGGVERFYDSKEDCVNVCLRVDGCVVVMVFTFCFLGFFLQMPPI